MWLTCTYSSETLQPHRTVCQSLSERPLFIFLKQKLVQIFLYLPISQSIKCGNANTMGRKFHILSFFKFKKMFVCNLNEQIKITKTLLDMSKTGSRPRPVHHDTLDSILRNNYKTRSRLMEVNV